MSETKRKRERAKTTLIPSGLAKRSEVAKDFQLAREEVRRLWRESVALARFGHLGYQRLEVSNFQCGSVLLQHVRAVVPRKDVRRVLAGITEHDFPAPRVLRGELGDVIDFPIDDYPCCGKMEREFVAREQATRDQTNQSRGTRILASGSPSPSALCRATSAAVSFDLIIISK